MILEVLAVLALGIFVVWFLLAPFIARQLPPSLADPPIAEETARGQALLALRDLDFERETGKLSEADYADLKTKYRQEALALLDAEPADPAEALVSARMRARLDPVPAGDRISCPQCGDRPEPDARYCSSCGASLESGALCPSCKGRLEIGDRFCRACGGGVAPTAPRMDGGLHLGTGGSKA
ncbi:MAG: zinc ribbon domain-containing protein [Gemmatimonadota bacterium]